MTRVTLVAGGDAAAREKAIAERLSVLQQVPVSLAVILEGGTGTGNDASFAPPIQTIRLAPACPCCVGNLAMRVTLNRILRQPPAHILISLEQAAHLEGLRKFLTQSPYDQHLTLTDNLII